MCIVGWNKNCIQNARYIHKNICILSCVDTVHLHTKALLIFTSPFLTISLLVHNDRTSCHKNKNPHFFSPKKCSSQLEILYLRNATWSKSHTEDQQLGRSLWTTIFWRFLFGAYETVRFLYVRKTVRRNYAKKIRNKEKKLSCLEDQALGTCADTLTATRLGLSRPENALNKCCHNRDIKQLGNFTVWKVAFCLDFLAVATSLKKRIFFIFCLILSSYRTMFNNFQQFMTVVYMNNSIKRGLERVTPHDHATYHNMLSFH